jgi:hypothetical protein
VIENLLQMNQMVSVMVKDILLMFLLLLLQTWPFSSTMTIVMVVTSKVLESLAKAQLPLLLLVTLP